MNLQMNAAVERFTGGEEVVGPVSDATASAFAGVESCPRPWGPRELCWGNDRWRSCLLLEAGLQVGRKADTLGRPSASMAAMRSASDAADEHGPVEYQRGVKLHRLRTGPELGNHILRGGNSTGADEVEAIAYHVMEGGEDTRGFFHERYAGKPAHFGPVRRGQRFGAIDCRIRDDQSRQPILRERNVRDVCDRIVVEIWRYLQEDGPVLDGSVHLLRRNADATEQLLQRATILQAAQTWGVRGRILMVT